MAARTSASVGIMVTLAIFGVLSLALFVLAIVFFARVQRLTTDLNAAKNDLAVAVRADEQGDRWEELKRLAGSRVGVVRYLDTSLQESMKAITGNPRETSEGLKGKITQAVGADAPALLRVIADRAGEMETLKTNLERSNAARDEAQAQLLAAVQRQEAVKQENQRTIDKLSGELTAYKTELERYRSGVEDTKSFMTGEVTRVKSESETTISSLQSQLDKMEADSLILKDQIRTLRGERTKETLRPADEATLIDGRIVGVNVNARQVYVDLGKRNRLVVGLTFEVYDAGASIREDEKGEYPPGKATIEVIRVDETTSLCRILRERKGNPILDGDVLANAVYDPRKVYTFTVYGNFDLDGDGLTTPQETDQIKSLISSWGGKVADDINGETDFLVLGTKPILPPQPRPDDPIELITRFVNLKQASQKYDDNFRTATQTGIPVLNQNRLFTLTGLSARER
ncbi:MAG TPA: hypothetical protein VG797_04950 [Phycisphaerales bacterium]|nr:hypothetical protein [Phycisphaerales bacterium]